MSEAELLKYVKMIFTLEFWEKLLYSFQILGPLAPILLAAIESFIPVLPLVAIVALNVAAHGGLLGFLYSWAGTCLGCMAVFLFFRRVVKGPFSRLADRSAKVNAAREWVNRFNPATLFFLAILPFTPSSFLNFAFGVSDFDERKYLLTMFGAKVVMIGLLALFGQSVVEALEKPVYIVLAVVLLLVLWWISRIVRKRHGL